MNWRIMILLGTTLALLAHASGAIRWAGSRLVYAGIIPHVSNARDPSRPPMLALYDRTDWMVPAGATILVGDSIAFRAPFTGSCIANRGIGGERSDQLLANLGRWKSLDRAGAVVIAIGTNDVWQHRSAGLGDRVAQIIDRIDAPVFLLGLSANLPGIEAANVQLRRACGPGCTFIAPIRALTGDGIHLARSGYAELARRIPLACAGPTMKV